MILARFDVEFHAELFYGQLVEIRTSLSHLGNSSFTVTQQAWQAGHLAAQGNTVMVHYDHERKQATPITGDLRQALREHLQEKDEARQ
ncbi:hypothetical protein L861_21590 [Litchfieldella anticariensis FP35 = DSM 16096]|uniref:Uncharacterized protein n=1 Tax=Litchfieldella anticariensis (strain DSM 16096 / CECT 5854 / CIP 108499 / LMG 22089 / FP35) TaxID=1121939 RepID=S2LAU4_LITA3|nr:hypothetical protein L861_21590 [Halomonas anticariensis FP35 = DSM 16096]